MKIALCLHGQPRNYLLGFSHFFENIISKYATDVFIHSWWSKELAGQQYVVNNQTVVEKQYLIEENLDVKLQKLFNPKEIALEYPLFFQPGKIYPVSDPANHNSIYNALMSRCYSMKKCVELRNKFSMEEYDFTIISRFDLAIYSFPNLFSLKPSEIYFSDGHPNRPYTFYDFIMITGEHYNYIGNMYDHVLTTFEKQQHLTQEDKENCHYDPYMTGPGNGFGFHELLAFYFLYGGLLDKTHKISELNTYYIR